MFVPRRPRFTRDQLTEAVAASRSWSETLRRLEYRSAGGNWKTLQKYAALWGISSDHFDPNGRRLIGIKNYWPSRTPLEEVLIRDSSFSRSHLKERLFDEGLKSRSCEMCGQGEIWRGLKMALILDHVNGTPDDHRFENLRVLCPNCAATLKTHCGRKNRLPKVECGFCGLAFRPTRRSQRYCSAECGSRQKRNRMRAGRRVERPPYEQLIREIGETSYLAVGRKYGVSDNAIRKWVRFYERENERRRSE